VSLVWEEIHGFVSPGEYARFLRYLERQVSAGYVREVPVDPEYGAGEIYGGRWFEDLETRSVGRLIPPDPPFRGLWEAVRPAA
jgi:hypothetical protein